MLSKTDGFVKIPQTEKCTKRLKSKRQLNRLKHSIISAIIVRRSEQPHRRLEAHTIENIMLRKRS